MDTGICHVIYCLYRRYAAPISRASADISPILPPIFPIKASNRFNLAASPIPFPVRRATCKSPSGVAPVVASIPVKTGCGTGHFVI